MHAPTVTVDGSGAGEVRDGRAWLLAGVMVCLGAAALATRSVGYGAVAVTACVGAASIAVPMTGRTEVEPRGWTSAVAIGVLAFAAVRLMVLPAVVQVDAWRLLVTSAAGVAEEAFFRGLAYGWLVRWGPVAAAVGAAVLFAAVHVPMYGAAAIPIDLGAGLLFGWQRWATKGWSAPAVTHVAANL